MNPSSDHHSGQGRENQPDQDYVDFELVKKEDDGSASGVIRNEIDGENEEEKKRLKGAKTFFHFYAGLLILGVDWLAFTMNLPTGFLATFLTSTVAFFSAWIAVYHVQKNFSGDSFWVSALKATFGAVAAGIPFPIAGTLLGGVILMLSGLKPPADILKKK